MIEDSRDVPLQTGLCIPDSRLSNNLPAESQMCPDTFLIHQTVKKEQDLMNLYVSLSAMLSSQQQEACKRLLPWWRCLRILSASEAAQLTVHVMSTGFDGLQVRPGGGIACPRRLSQPCGTGG